MDTALLMGVDDGFEGLGEIGGERPVKPLWRIDRPVSYAGKGACKSSQRTGGVIQPRAA